MMIKKLVTVIVLSFLFSPASYAGFVNGNTLVEECKADENTVDEAFCYGYVLGVHDGHIMDMNSAFISCVPEGVTSVQMVSVVRKFMAENPQFLHKSASSLVAAALSGAFPCPD